MNTEETYALGIDIGGTNTLYAVVNTSGKILYSQSLLTTDYQEPEDLLRCIADGVKTSGYTFQAVGIGAPNGSSVTGRIENAPNLSWKGLIPLEEIAKNVFKTPVKLTNDANAAGLGECAWGNCRGYSDIIMLTIGTGLGCSLIAHSKLIEGARGFAGEFGHITAEVDGRPCKCGKKGCLEQYVSAQGIVTTYIEQGGQQVPNVKDIFLSTKENEIAQRTIRLTAEKLGLHLANLINIFNPEAVCIAGGIAKSGDLLLPYLERSLEEHTLPMLRGSVKIHFSTLENQTAGVLGAAYLAFEKLISNEDFMP